MAAVDQRTTLDTPRFCRAAEALDEWLGDPRDHSSTLSFRYAVHLDERSAFPEKARRALDEWGLARCYLPRDAGGRLEGYDELATLLRTVARRDLTAAIAHVNTFVAATPVWLAGSEQQKRRVADIIRAGRSIALAFHEAAHGSDLAATACEAVPVDGGYRVTGEKWLIGNATRGTAVLLLARTPGARGARSLSLFLIDKRHLPADSLSYLERARTLGLRGADVSGLSLDGCPATTDDLVGRAGDGVAVALRAFQISRTVLAACSLGAADTALRATLAFARDRRLYGSTVFDIPHARSLLVHAFLDVIISECVVLAAARALHAAPQCARLWSAVAKYFVPVTLEATVRDLAVVLGARYYLREGHWDGIFQKMLRDTAAISVFHAGTFLNLTAIAAQLRYLDTRRSSAQSPSPDWTSVFSLQASLPPFDAGRLTLDYEPTNHFTTGLDAAFAQLERDGAVDDTVVDALRAEWWRLDAATSLSAGFWDDLRARHGKRWEHAPELFDAARAYCSRHAAAACVHFWLFNRHHADAFFSAGDWLVLCLQRLNTPFEPLGTHVRHPAAESAACHLVQLADSNRLFSLFPFNLA